MTTRSTARRATALLVITVLLAGCGSRQPSGTALAASPVNGDRAPEASGVAGSGTNRGSAGSVTGETTVPDPAAPRTPPGPGSTGPNPQAQPATTLPATTRPTDTGAAPSSTSTVRAVATGVHGIVTAGPTCPVERPDRPCPPRPVAATRIEARTANGGLAGATTSDADGRYTLRLVPGSYTLTVVAGVALPRCPAVTAAVPTGGEATADIVCDSGIR